MNQPGQTMQINLPAIVAELNLAFDTYEAALIRNDVEMLDEFIWYDPQTVRYGGAEILYGGEAIRAYCRTCAPVHLQRQIVRKVTTSYGSGFGTISYGSGFGTISVEFSAPDTERIGRQMQTWVRFPQGWRIVAAHVSLL